MVKKISDLFRLTKKYAGACSEGGYKSGAAHRGDLIVRAKKGTPAGALCCFLDGGNRVENTKISRFSLFFAY